MAAKILLLLASVACAQAIIPVGYGPYGAAPAYAAAPTITSQQSNIYRNFGNTGQVSAYSKTIDTPFSSVRKSDVRVSNPGAYAYAAPAYAAPAYAAHGVVAPAYAAHGVVAPAYAAHGVVAPAYAAHGVVAPKVVGAGLLGVAYSAAPTVAHMTFSNPLINYAW